MAGLSIIGSGHFVPGRPYTNHDLAKVLDTNDEWIRQRTGIAQRHFAAPDQGPSHLALPAAISGCLSQLQAELEAEQHAAEHLARLR